MLKIKDLPKIDLHCHIDGSLRESTILELARNKKLINLNDSIEDIITSLHAPHINKSLVEYLKCFDLPISIMQTEGELERVTYELFEDAALEDVKYMEVRFAPLLHTKEGLTIEKIIKSVLRGLSSAEKLYEIKGNLILGCMRNMSEKDAILVIKAGKEFLGRGVVGIDLCGSEIDGFCFKYKKAYKLAKSYGYNLTVHAGEAASANNISDGIKLLGANRIGHGVRMQDSKEVYELVKNKGVALEICPTSNIQTGAVKSIEEHPFYKYLNDDIIVTINTDNRTVSNVTMTSEVGLILKTKNMNYVDYKKIYNNSVKCSFADIKIKKWLETLI